MAHLLANAIRRKLGGVPVFDVSKLNPYVFNWTIRVKIIRRYEDPGNIDASINFVLSDIEGDKIKASIDHQYVEKFSTELKEGNWIIFEGFDMVPETATFRPTKHPFKIICREGMIIRKIPLLYSSEFFDFAKLSDINDGIINPDFATDLIGEVVNVGNFINRMGVKRRRTCGEMYFDLQDEWNTRLHVKLAAEYVEEFMDSYARSGNGICICVMRFAKIEKTHGFWRATTSRDCTMVIVNPSFDEALKLRSRILSRR